MLIINEDRQAQGAQQANRANAHRAARPPLPPQDHRPEGEGPLGVRAVRPVRGRPPRKLPPQAAGARAGGTEGRAFRDAARDGGAQGAVRAQVQGGRSTEGAARGGRAPGRSRGGRPPSPAQGGSPVFREPAGEVIRLLKFKLAMYIDKENLHPNVAHLIRQKKSLDHSAPSHSSCSRRPEDWRQRVMCPSFREKEIEEKLRKMLDSQKSVKECMHTTLSEDKMVNSFASSPNYTLQKYFQQDHSPPAPDHHTRRKDLVEILQIAEKIVEVRTDNLEALSEAQLLQLIKGKLISVLPTRPAEPL